MEMIKKVTSEEVRETMFSMDNNKTPDLNGFGAFSFQECLEHCRGRCG